MEKEIKIYKKTEVNKTANSVKVQKARANTHEERKRTKVRNTRERAKAKVKARNMRELKQ